MRNTNVTSWLGCGLAAIVVAAAAQAALQAQTDQKAAEILAGARKAIGNKQLESLSTFSVEGVIQRNIGERQLSTEVELLLGLPDKYIRTDTPAGMGNSMSSGFNGDKVIRPAGMTMLPGGGGMVIRMGGGGGPASFGGAAPAEKLTPEQQAEADKMALRSSRHDVSRLMLGWFAMAHPAANAQYKLAGEAESPDGKAWVIDVTNSDGFSARLFIDQQTNLPLMVNYQGPQARVMTMGGPRAAGSAPGSTAVTSGGGAQTRELSDEERKKMREEAEKQIQQMQREAPTMVDYTLFFEDWQQADGVMFPHKIRRASGGSTNEEWTVNKVRVNPKIDPKKFSAGS